MVRNTGAPGLVEADVYGDDGVRTATYRWPSRVRLGIASWIGEGTLLGVTTDSLDVQRVAEVRFTEDGGDDRR